MLYSFTVDPDALREKDVELFVAPFRQPARARAGSALYRGFIMPEAVRIMAGRYRHLRLSTPTRVLVGADVDAVDEFVEELLDHVRAVVPDGSADPLADVERSRGRGTLTGCPRLRHYRSRRLRRGLRVATGHMQRL